LGYKGTALPSTYTPRISLANPDKFTNSPREFKLENAIAWYKYKPEKGIAMFLGLQPIHIVFILLVALLVFGPRKLPEMGRSIGKALNEFRNGAKEVTDSLRTDINGSVDNPVMPVGGNPAPTPAAPYQAGSILPPKTGNFCIHCGAANAPEARFCNQCGQKLPENSLNPANPAVQGQQ
jgi:sec-independent protein translocase protein TatA